MKIPLINRLHAIEYTLFQFENFSESFNQKTLQVTILECNKLITYYIRLQNGFMWLTQRDSTIED